MIKSLKAIETGRLGEKLAAKYLKRNGYKIIAANKHQSHKELDIIASDKEYIVFVEVKTRGISSDRQDNYGTAASAVDKRKQSNLIYAARAYMAQNPTNKQPRMDVIEVYLDKNTRKLTEINHIRNAYFAR